MTPADKRTYFSRLALYYKNRARLKGCTAAVHLEADFDRLFWDQVFRQAAPDCRFDYVTFSRNPLGQKATGCSVCLRYMHYGCLSDGFFVCIDSDYRRLMREPRINTGHYVFQTYTYSLENHFCHPDNILDTFRRLGLGRPQFDFAAFLKEYSEALYPLFLYHLLSVETDDDVFPMSEFAQYMSVDVAEPDRDALIRSLRKRVRPKELALQKIYAGIDTEKLAARFGHAGLRPENAWLYLRGHNMLDQVVMKLVKQLRSRLETGVTVDYDSHHKREYYEERLNFKQHLMMNLSFGAYPEIVKLEDDADKFCKRYSSRRRNG
ncbi:MAG: DUF4435 domain-containing protein [Tannerellaceae bacterium]|jgi:hypothetical protein|nr:DUF4435 domain-containing protein [Tannerellaceae bacterium]